MKATKPENIHITLKYLGKTDSRTIEKVLASTRKIARTSPYFNLEIGQPRTLSNSPNSRIIYAEIGGDLKALTTLQYKLERALINLGYPSDRQEYKPHLTLARLKYETPSSNSLVMLLDLLSDQLKDKVRIEVKEICLFRSTLHPQGAIYHNIAAIKLSPNNEYL